MWTKRQLAIFCSWLMIWTTVLPSQMAGQTAAAGSTALREQAILMAAGSVVEVKLKSKEKLLGRMGAISNEGFDIQYAKGGQLESRNVSFQDVKSIKLKDRGMPMAGKITLGVLAGVGVVFLVLIAVVAASGGWD